MIQCSQCLLDWNVALESMDLIEIDRINTESFQTRVASLKNVLAGEATHVRSVTHWEMNFRSEHDLFHVRHFSQRTPSDQFARTHRVHVCRVEKVDSKIERFFVKRSRLRLIEYPWPPLRASIAHASETN